ncbi:type I 3-dehydroquinate dehydratase [Rhodoferax sp. UBA5149]|uniref:type I 3-dehydroquinate dehydratase n=1 Tax=Rhodoferax sp. UBA5149 TaxID=1947379 RepID=UPI0025DE514E|nr:type I 3-dehydroquinate dehydratase [Rhodoferax sp. UBA5149]
MQMGKPIELHGTPLGGGKFPLVCTPLVGRTRDKILSEVQLVLAKKPDILEWRVDFFENIGKPAEVISVAASIRQAAGGIPLVFTRRSVKEGGEKIALSEDEVVALYQAVCESRCADIVDFEMSNDAAHVRRVREVSKVNDTKLILSFHNFSFTPGLELLNQRFLEAEQLGADIAKVAVVPRNLEDVLTLLTATLKSSQKLKIPLISMSMGGYGSLTRLFGGAFGSALTFAVGASSSAPGQVPIEDLNTVLGILQKSMAGT